MARWSATHPWRAIALWLASVVVSLVVGGAAGTVHASESDQAVGESGRAAHIVAAGKFDSQALENVLITSRSGRLDQSAAAAAASEIIRRMRALPEVSKVEGPVPSANGDALLVRITMAGDEATAYERVTALLHETSTVQGQYPALRVEEAGTASVRSGVAETIGRDFQHAEAISLPLSLAILIIAFGALIAAGVPVLLALSAVATAIGLTSLFSHVFPAVDSISSMILLIGMAVGVDYSLFYLRREREERRKGHEDIDAVTIAAATSGHTVVLSGTAVIVAMAGLYLASDVTFSSLATGAIVVVAVAMIGSLTVLPAMLAKLGRWVDRPRVPLLWRLADREGKARLWPWLLRPALRWPLPTLLVSTLLLLALAVPALGMKLKLPGLEDLPRTVPVMQVYDRLTAAFPTAGSSFEVAVRVPDGGATEVRSALADLATRAGNDPLFVSGPAAPPRFSADGRVATLILATPFTETARSGDALRRLRTTLLPDTVGRVPGADYAVGGIIAISIDYTDHLKQRLPWVIGFVLALTLVVMVATFRSVVVGLVTIALNMVSAGASFGFVVLVFQRRWAEHLLDFTSIGAVVAWLPLFLFVVLFGLSMDYHVFVLSRVREGISQGQPTRRAVVEGISNSAGVVTSAAVVMVGVFSVFATLRTIDMKQLGVGLAAAILLDATIVRAVLLPSLMVLFGDAFWWAPRFLRREAPSSPEPTDDPTPEPQLQPIP